MKKIIIIIITIVLCGACSYYEHNYTRGNCKIVQINDGILTIEDFGGNYWDIYKPNSGFQVGDIVVLKMHDNLTPHTIEDDIIKGIIQ